jgi:hypothetical protein
MVKTKVLPLAVPLHNERFSAARPSQIRQMAVSEARHTVGLQASEPKPNQNLIRRFNLKVEPGYLQVDGQ